MKIAKWLLIALLCAGGAYWLRETKVGPGSAGSHTARVPPARQGAASPGEAVIAAMPAPPVPAVSPPAMSGTTAQPSAIKGVPEGFVEYQRRRNSKISRQALRDSMDDPTRIREMRAMGKETMSDLIKALGLSPQQVERFLDVLIEKQKKVYEITATDPVEVKARLDDLESEANASLMSVFGMEKYLKYESHQTTLVERADTGNLNQALEESIHAPLGARQQEQVVEAMVDIKRLLPKPSTERLLSMPSTAEDREKLLKWRTEYLKLLRQRVAGILTFEQLQQYDKEVENELMSLRSMVDNP